jgi:hypothetical protein
MMTQQYRVYAALDGRIAFVNAFPGEPGASALVDKLSQRYGRFGALFWHVNAISDTARIDVCWAILRDKLRRAEPMRLANPLSGQTLIEIGAPPAPLVEAQIDTYLSAGGTITIARPHQGAAPARKRPDRRRFGLPDFAKANRSRR